VMNDELSRLHGVHGCTEWASGKSPEICVAVQQQQSAAGLAGPMRKALQMARRMGNRRSGQHQSMGRTVTECGKLKVRSVSRSQG